MIGCLAAEKHGSEAAVPSSIIMALALQQCMCWFQAYLVTVTTDLNLPQQVGDVFKALLGRTLKQGQAVDCCSVLISGVHPSDIHQYQASW
jgi:hypothetical protein